MIENGGVVGVAIVEDGMMMDGIVMIKDGSHDLL